MNWYVYEGVRTAARTLETLIASLKGEKNAERIRDASFGMLGRESKETGKPLREVVTEFREQCNRYVIEHDEMSNRDTLPATTDPRV